MIHKNIILNSDYDAVATEYQSQFYALGFDYTDPMNKLSRIDYKQDIITEHKDIYIKLLKKGSNNYRALKQYSKYKTSVYYKSKSKNINIYDKQQEQADRLQIVDENYTNMIRFEVQLKRNRLHYLLKNEGICRELLNYWNVKEKDYHINKELQKLIYSGDYYNLYHSEKKLMEHYTKNMTDKLLELQKDISLNGVSAARLNYNTATFRNYISLLQEAQVNPIPIPKGEGITHLKNLFNFTDSNIYLLDNYKLKVAV